MNLLRRNARLFVIYLTFALAALVGGPAMLPSTMSPFPLSPSPLLAQDAAPSATPAATALPQRGALASTTDRGYGTQASPSQWGGFELEGKHNSPITAAVSRGKAGTWELSVFNNSEDRYTVTVALEQVGKSGGRLKSDSFTMALKGGEKQRRSVPAQATATGATVNLVRWSKEAKAVPPTATATAVAEAAATTRRVKPTPKPKEAGFEEWPQAPTTNRLIPR
jgi:hypothetical protein